MLASGFTGARKVVFPVILLSVSILLSVICYHQYHCHRVVLVVGINPAVGRLC